MYGNEREVGEGVRASGLRGEVMVTTKIQPTNLAPRDVESLGQGKPARARARRHRPVADPLAEPARAARRHARRHGQAQACRRHAPDRRLQFHRRADRTKPPSSRPTLVCNQVECHPFLNQDKVLAACRKHGMAMVAYSPVARSSAAGDKVLDAHRQGARQERGADIAALPHAAGHRRHPAHQQGRAAGGELRHFRFCAHRRRDAGDSCARRPATGASSTGAGRRNGIEPFRAA